MSRTVEAEHFTVEDHADRDAWVGSRVDSIGASEAAVVWGVSPYDTPASLWLKKTGRAPELEDDAEWLELGNVLEEPIARMAARRTGRRLEDWGRNTRLRSKRWPWMTATLDRVQYLDDGVIFGPLEVKNRSAWTHEDWSAGAPLHLQLQLQHQLAVTGWQHGSIVVLRGGARIDVIDIPRDDELIEMHVEKCGAFWCDVRDDIAPVADGSEHLAMAARNAARLARAEEIELGPAAEEAAAAVMKLRAAEKQIETARREAENHLLMALAVGGVQRGRLPSGGVVTAQVVSRRAYTAEVKASSFVQLRVKPAKGRELAANDDQPALEAAQED